MEAARPFAGPGEGRRQTRGVPETWLKPELCPLLACDPGSWYGLPMPLGGWGEDLLRVHTGALPSLATGSAWALSLVLRDLGVPSQPGRVRGSKRSGRHPR